MTDKEMGEFLMLGLWGTTSPEEHGKKKTTNKRHNNETLHLHMYAMGQRIQFHFSIGANVLDLWVELNDLCWDHISLTYILTFHESQ